MPAIGEINPRIAALVSETQRRTPPSDLSAAIVTRQNLQNQILALYPELGDDARALFDTLAGLDDFEEQVLAVLRHAIEREANGKALGEMIATMTGRKRRLEDGAKSFRLAALHAMQEAGVNKMAAPDMTVSVGRGKPKVQIVDPDKVPDDLCRVSREPSKSDIAKAIAEGRTVPGVALGNPQPFLTVHRQ